jgi:hypothetical protein
VVVLSIHPSHHPSRKFLIPEEEDDGTGGGRRLMAMATIYPHVHVILLAQFVLALRNCFCVVCRNLAERTMVGQQQQKPNGGTEKRCGGGVLEESVLNFFFKSALFVAP